MMVKGVSSEVRLFFWANASFAMCQLCNVRNHLPTVNLDLLTPQNGVNINSLLGLLEIEIFTLASCLTYCYSVGVNCHLTHVLNS